MAGRRKPSDNSQFYESFPVAPHRTVRIAVYWPPRPDQGSSVILSIGGPNPDLWAKANCAILPVEWGPINDGMTRALAKYEELHATAAIRAELGKTP